jgi:dihydroorotase
VSTSKRILIKNGRVIDPANRLDEVCDILVEGSKVAKVSKAINPALANRENTVSKGGVKASADRVIDAAGKLVIPGLVDMHVHLREPGREDKETVKSATMAALHGGVTSLLAMANTEPAMDCAESIELLKGIIKDTAFVNVFIAGTITKGRFGDEPTDPKVLKEAGVVAISDDGASVDSDKIMEEALSAAKKEDILVICHCEDKRLSNNGVVNLGTISTRMGLRGICNESEYKRIDRDIQLAQKTGTRIHIAHVSCKESLEIIAKAKKKGARVSCEVTPHHLCLTEEAVLGYDTNFKMNPPLRSRDDVAAIRKGLKDGTIDAIASDHAPHTENEKEIEFDRAEFGVIGLQTQLAVGITELVDKGLLDWTGLVERLSLNPARILGLTKGALSVGRDADIVVISPDEEWVVRKETIVSKSKNSAFLGRTLKGVVEYTICGGKVYEVAGQ